MNWYYANAGQQVGPISEADFDGLVRAGTVKADTLVWREGMANWQSFGTVAAAQAGAATGTGGAGTPAGGAATGTDTARVATAEPTALSGATTGGFICAECGRAFPPDEVIRYGTVAVCANCKPIFLQKLREGVVAPAGVEYGGFWIRFAAWFVDSIVLFVVTLLLDTLILAVTGMKEHLAPGNFAQMLIVQGVLGLVNMVIQIAYETWFVGRFGATPGKMACNIKVVTPSGDRVGYGRAFGRSVAKILSTLILGIGYLMAAFDDQKRALHDRICDTRVIKNR
ncbi:MAG: RDD family protein [Verrucomicrobiales bacterium]|nr:RDD family protein [Verrucomicrobiales bacterium]